VPQPPPVEQYGAPHHDAIKQLSLPQLAPVYLPVPPVYEPEWFKLQSHSVPSPDSGSNNAFNHGQNFHSTAHSSDGPGHGVEGSQSDIDVVQSMSLIEDSHPVASQHPASSSSHDESLPDEFSSHSVPNASHLINSEFNLPSGLNYQPPDDKHQLKNIPQKNETQELGLEIIPSVQVTDYLSSVEYPVQIVQSPYIDVTAPPHHDVRHNTEQQNYDNHSPAHPSSFYGEGEVVIGKPVLAASKLNNTNTKTSYSTVDANNQNNVSDVHDQKQQQSVIHETNILENSNKGPPILDQSPSSAVKPSSPDNAYLASDNQLKHPAESINVLGEYGIKQEPSLKEGDIPADFQIQPSVQTSAEGNSLIHQINNAFHSDIGPTTTPPTQNKFQSSYSSGYVLFQNFPEPPLSSLPADVLKQKLPAPIPFQSTFRQNPYLPPQTATNPFEHALSLETSASFLSPPPKDNGEYSTVTNTPIPEYTFWTPTSRPHPISLSPAKKGTPWGSETTQKPFKQYNQDVIAAFAEAAGLLPPPPSLPQSLNQSNKKTKQIQIIVPYTSSKELMQFKVQDTSKPIFDTTGWSPVTRGEDVKLQGRKAPSLQVNCSDDEGFWKQCKNITSLPWQEQSDYHQHQESRTVEATAPVAQTDKEITQPYPYRNNSEIQHIFAANIRDVLGGEEEVEAPDYITLQRLQKHIDEWTALEYSKWKDPDGFNATRNTDGGRKSTAAPTSSGTLFQRLLVPSKKIPEEYLTTTPSLFDDVTSTENSVATVVPSFENSRSSTTISTTEPYFGSQTRIASSGERNYTPKLNHDIPFNHQRKGENYKWKIIESNHIIPEALAVTTKENPGATVAPPTTATPLSEEVTDTQRTTWDQIPLSISPVTNEKVYVVTPMSNWVPDTTTTPTPYQTPPYSAKTRSTSINDVFPFRNGPPSAQKLVASAPFSFKSPRFVIRPTPAMNVHRSYTLALMEDSDDWSGVKTSNKRPVRLNKIDGNAGKINKD
jgi:hypothetical protein